MDMELKGMRGFIPAVSAANHVFVLHVLNFAEFLKAILDGDGKGFLYDAINEFFIVSEF